MDLVTLGIFLVCFIVVCALVGLISILGTKEQSYEDGLKASRQRQAGPAKEKPAKKGRGPKAAKEPTSTKSNKTKVKQKSLNLSLQLPRS